MEYLSVSCAVCGSSGNVRGGTFLAAQLVRAEPDTSQHRRQAQHGEVVIVTLHLCYEKLIVILVSMRE